MSDNNKNRGKKRSKSYYLKCSSKQIRHKPSMAIGQKGFLVTCNNRERECTRETYGVLNKYADKLYGPEEPEKSKQEEGVIDIEEEVKREVESLKNSLLRERRFQALESKARNCIFIRASVPDPSHLIHEILTDIQTTQKQCSRYILRATPVLSVCRAGLDDIKSCAEQILPQYFENVGPNGKTYSIIFKVRNNATVSRNDVIPAIGGVISRLSTLNKADLNSPDLAVLVDVIGKLCCFGVAKNYYGLKKYNLAELVIKTEEVKTESTQEVKTESSETPEVKTESSETREVKTESSETREVKTESSETPEVKTDSSKTQGNEEQITSLKSELPLKIEPGNETETAEV